MLKIRLQRVGRKHEPTYRVVVCDSKRGPKSGDNIEILGSYDARDKNETKVDGDRVKHWIDNGAQVSDTVHNLLINLGIIKGDKKNVLPKKSPIIDEEKLKAEEEAKAAASAEASSGETKEAEAQKEESEETPEEAPADAESSGEAKPVEEEKESADANSDETKEEKSASE
jgi:small subunit ribosomal protein S16